MFDVEGVMETGFSFSHAVPAPPERRQNERHIRILRVGTLIVDGRRELCLIRDISAGGLRAHIYSKLTDGARVAIELKCREPVTGQVVWVSGSNVGVKFDTVIEVAELLAHPAVKDGGWQPRTPRVEIDRMATLREGGRTHWVHARDISQRGIRVETEHLPPANSEVVVALDGLRPLPGIVRWSDGKSAGIAFNDVVPFTDLVDWLKSQA